MTSDGCVQKTLKWFWGRLIQLADFLGRCGAVLTAGQYLTHQLGGLEIYQWWRVERKGVVEHGGPLLRGGVRPVEREGGPGLGQLRLPNLVTHALVISCQTHIQIKTDLNKLQSNFTESVRNKV